MLWQKGRSSDNVEQATGGGRGAWGFAPHIGIGGIALIVIVSLLFHQNPLTILGMLSGNGSMAPAGNTPAQVTQANAADPQVQFVKKVLGSTEDVWTAYFQQMGKTYVDPKLVLFRGQVATACGGASTAVGPFYCPGDKRVYLDLDFFRQMQTQFNSNADFARAYVIAHEVGHHVQDQLGIMAMEQKLADRGEPMKGANGLSVRLELQADCFAGVWANRSQAQLQWLQAGDIESALSLASAIGDNALEKAAQGVVVPDSFTHGTSEQRVRWFKTGFQAGDIKACDTFNAQTL